MIEGLKIDITEAELRGHLQDRSDHHVERERFYNARAADLDKDQKGAEVEHWDFANSGRGDPRDQMRQAAKQHAERASYFTFLASHLVTGETYRLTEGEFRTLELVSKYL